MYDAYQGIINAFSNTACLTQCYQVASNSKCIYLVMVSPTLWKSVSILTLELDI